jgi:hypothetical protein
MNLSLLLFNMNLCFFIFFCLLVDLIVLLLKMISPSTYFQKFVFLLLISTCWKIRKYLFGCIYLFYTSFYCLLMLILYVMLLCQETFYWLVMILLKAGFLINAISPVIPGHFKSCLLKHLLDLLLRTNSIIIIIIKIKSNMSCL